MTNNPFANPYSAITVSPSNTVNLKHPSVVYCGGAGNIKVTSATNSGTVTFNNVQAGEWLRLVVNKVWASDTTCSGIIATW